MKYSLSLVTLALLFTSNVKAWYKPTQNDSWNIALGSRIDLSSEPAKIIEIDLENNSADEIKRFHNNGKKVICYFSGGTVEKYRSYYNEYLNVDGLVKNTYEAWDDEKWIDYRVSDYKRLIKQRMSEAVKKGCDLIDVDNVDGYQIKDTQKWSKPLTKSDAITFLKWLGQTAHSMGLGIGLKNCLDIVDTVGSYYDFAVNEGCAPKNECHWYKNFLKSGKPVLGITYYGLSKNKEALCRNLNGLPITMIVKEGQSLKQKSEIFDGKKHCSNFSSGKVEAPKQEKQKKTTKKTTTTTKKTTTTTTVKKTTTTTTVKKTTTVIRKETEIPAVSIKTPAVPYPKPVPTVTKVSDNKVTGTTVSAAFNPATTPVAPVVAPVKNTPVNPVKQGPTTGPKVEKVEKEEKETAKVADKQAPIISNIDGDNEEEEEGGSGAAAAVGISGSVLGAAAVFVFLKKNPRKYETIKRGLSRRATTIKRGASTLSRRVTTRSRI